MIDICEGLAHREIERLEHIIAEYKLALEIRRQGQEALKAELAIAHEDNCRLQKKYDQLAARVEANVPDPWDRHGRWPSSS